MSITSPSNHFTANYFFQIHLSHLLNFFSVLNGERRNCDIEQQGTLAIKIRSKVASLIARSFVTVA